MGTALLALAAVLTGIAAFLAGRASRPKANPPTTPLPGRRSIFVERVEAPGSRPIRVCGRRSCRRPIVKMRDGDEMVVRIEGESILYLHGECSDAAGEPLP